MNQKFVRGIELKAQFVENEYNMKIIIENKGGLQINANQKPDIELKGISMYRDIQKISFHPC